MTARRLATGGRIDRDRALSFRWDGKLCRGYHGDSLSAALLAHGETVIARSFKYHRPRGVMSSGVDEAGGLVTLGYGARRDANVNASTQELFDGLVARGQNAWPNVRADVGAINNLLSRFLAAGFYYKTFMGPRLLAKPFGTAMWMNYEKLIRRAAGMGRAARRPDADGYDQAHGYCDVLVVGGGPAGLQAALVAATAGRDVWLVEQDRELGGDWLSQPAAQEAERMQLVAAVKAAGVRIMTRTTAFGLYDGGVAGLVQRLTDHLACPAPHQPRQCFWTLRAGYTILATGALARPIAFGNNDRPMVMTIAAARTYLHRYGVLLGENIIIATNNDSAYTPAGELAQAGAKVTLLDARATVDAALMARVAAHEVSLHTRVAPLNARGRRVVTGVDLAVAETHGWRAHGMQPCDLLLVSGGWSPVVHLLSQRGVKPSWDAARACFIAPHELPNHLPITMAGAATALWQTDDCRSSGQVAGEVAIARGGSARSAMPAKSAAPATHGAGAPKNGGWARPILPLYEVRVTNPANERFHKSFVDPQHDVTTADIRLAQREGFTSVEHLKRYTTLGMGPDGGKVGNVIGLALMAEAVGSTIEQVGTTTFRPPYTPIALGALGGRHVGTQFKPLRRTPMHAWNLAHGATMTMAGLWHRPWYFARAGEDLAAAYCREATTVRARVGLCDVTSLGKIAIQGPDAATLIDRVYSNSFARLAVGKARYGIMLRDDGLVMDDGTAWRLGAHEYFMTTTTVHAASVMAWLEELLQTRWPDLKVHVTSVSEQWGGVALAGPLARAVLAECVANPAAVAHENLPFMGVADIELLNGLAARVARISFSGEMAYEIYVAADYATAMCDLLWHAVAARDGCLYGLEALGTLRIEKGHVTAAELDGRVSIDDAGLGRMASPRKAFIGSALRRRPELQRAERACLVGLKPKIRGQKFNAGAILCRADAISGLGEGWVTAVTHSPALGHWIGLGFIRGGATAWADVRVVAADPVRTAPIEVEIVSPHLVDPDGERMHG